MHMNSNFITLLFLSASKLSFLPFKICREIRKEVWMMMLHQGIVLKYLFLIPKI